jgi:hypothetical protein
MFFLTESSVCTADILAHGTSRDSLLNKFMESACRHLSAGGISVYAGEADKEEKLELIGSFAENANYLNYLMLQGTTVFRFRLNGEPDTDVTLKIIDYTM